MVKAFTGLGLGLALAGAPGPVQAVLLSETVRGGARRGFRAMAGAYLISGSVLAALALGISLTPPRGSALRIIDVLGGAVLLSFAIEGIRARGARDVVGSGRRSVPVMARGALSVVLNPGGWVFFATVATPLLAAAARLDGRAGALAAAGALLTGLAVGDGALVLLGGAGIRSAGERTVRWIQLVLATILAVLGVGLVVMGLFGR